MKKKVSIILALLIIAISFIVNISVFFVINPVLSNIEEKLISIIYPKRKFPPLEYKYLDIWEKIHLEALNKQIDYNKILIDYYANYYLYLFDKYNPRPYDNPIVDIPQEEIDLIPKKAATENDLQIFIAYYLRSLYIEAQINSIKNPNSPLINTDKNIVLWALKYFYAIIYYQWIKIWIQPLGVNAEQGFNIDFYTYGSFSQFDKNGNTDWTEGYVLRKPISNDLTNTIINHADSEDKVKIELLNQNEYLMGEEFYVKKKDDKFYAIVNKFSNFYFGNKCNEIELNTTNNETTCKKSECPTPMAIANKVLYPYINEIYDFVYIKRGK